MPLTIRDVRVTLTAPTGRNLVIVKVLTSEPDLHGIGCATFTQRYLPVRSAIEDYLKPLLIGRDPARIEELHRLMSVNSYWRGGPVLNNAISGIDMALWDIKAKLAGMPLYDLLGGKVREAAAVYQHADGRDLKELQDHVQQQLDQGMSYVRIRFGGSAELTRASGEAGGNAYGGPGLGVHHPPDGALDGSYYDPQTYTRTTLEAIAHVRQHFGDDIELLHDVHERLTPAQAIRFAKDLEPFRLFFLEDPIAPEDLGWYERLRNATTTPIAASELFTGPNEWLPLVSNRLIDFVRMHISDIGGLTPARKVATIAEAFGVRTAWHGPGDCSAVGHAVNLHLNVSTLNFGIHELMPFTDLDREIFPGCPEYRDGYLYPNNNPGHGIDLNEALAAKYPCDPKTIMWTQARLPDGSLARP